MNEHHAGASEQDKLKAGDRKRPNVAPRSVASHSDIQLTRMPTVLHKRVTGIVTAQFLGICVWMIVDFIRIWSEMSAQGVSLKADASVAFWVPLTLSTAVVVPMLWTGRENYRGLRNQFGEHVAGTELRRALLFCCSFASGTYIATRIFLLLAPGANPVHFWTDTRGTDFAGFLQIVVTVMFVAAICFALCYPGVHLGSACVNRTPPDLPRAPLRLYMIIWLVVLALSLSLYCWAGIGKVMVNSG